MFSKEVIALVKPCYEAIQVVAGKKCPECKGNGCFGAHTYRDPLNRLKCEKCNGTGKIKWEWEPKEGEWCLCRGRAYLITDIDDLGKGKLGIAYCVHLRKKNVIPLLPWEGIEKILGGTGWSRFQFGSWSSNGNISIISYKTGSGLTCSAVGKSRQLAVMLALIELGKRKENEKI